MTEQTITAHYSRVASTTLRTVKIPLERLPVKKKAWYRRQRHATSRTGGRGYLARSRARLAWGQRRPPEPRPTEGHVGHRALSNGSPGRACGGLRGLRP